MWAYVAALSKHIKQKLARAYKGLDVGLRAEFGLKVEFLRLCIELGGRLMLRNKTSKPLKPQRSKTPNP